MRRAQSGPRFRAPRRPLLPPTKLGLLLLSAIVVTNDGRCAAARKTQPSTCGRRFLVRQGTSNSSSSGDGDAATVPGVLSLSRGRGFMGAAMVDDPPLVVFAGGIGMGGKLVDSNVDAFSLPPLLRREDADNPRGGRSGADGEALVYRDVLSLAVARTDIGAASTTRALFLAGGCGMDVAPLSPGGRADWGTEGGRDEKYDSGPEIVDEGDNGHSGGGGSGRAGDDALDVPLLLKNCQATDAVDVFSLGVGNAAGPEARGEGANIGGKRTVAALGGLRLSEPKYAATIGVFYTGSPDNGDPSSWAPTAHVLVAGGIVPTSLAAGSDEDGDGDGGVGGGVGGDSVVEDVGAGDGEGVGGQYMATDTVDIFREDGVDAVSGEAKVTTLIGPRLPNPPRFEMTSCCFKHQCVFAGGRVSLGQGGVGFNSDRAEVWDGSTWSFATWGEHTLSEPRHLMGSAAIEISDGSDKRVVGLFVGGVSNNGDSSMVDMFDFDEHRVLPRMNAPTVRGPTQGVSLSREAAAFVGSTGEIDVFDGRTLCWTSYKAEGLRPGASVVGRSSVWFFSESSPGFQPSGGVDTDSSDGGAAEEASVFVGGGLGGDVASSGAGVSRDVLELRWSRMEGGDDMKACLGGTPLQQLQKVCGLPGPDGSIQAFTPRDQDRGSGSAGDRETARTIGSPSDGNSSGNRGSVVALYIMAALMGIFVSYMASATLIVRKVEGLWRLPFGGGIFEALCEGLEQCWRGFCRRCCCCCRCCLGRGQGSAEEAKRSKSSNRKTYGHAATAAAGEGTRLIFPQGGGDVEQPRRVRKPNRGGSNGAAGGRSSSLSSRGTTRDSSNGEGEGERSRPRSRSDSDDGSGGYGYSGGAASDCAGAALGSSSSAPGVSGQEACGSGNGGGHASFNARGSASGGGGGEEEEGGGRRVAAGREQRRSATATKKRRGGGLQILATSAVDAAAAAARLAEEIANDDEYGAGE